MLLLTNISITDRAAAVLQQEKLAFRARRGDVFALVYMFSFVNADGTIVEGFRPGYMAGPWPVEYLSARWAVARLPDGIEFHFMPRFEWNARARYIMDLVSPSLELFSIGPVAGR